MELLYIRIFDTNTSFNLSFINKDINFNGRYYFFLNEKTSQIGYDENKTYDEDLHGINTTVTGLIGGNGVGKTTFLKFLQYLIAKLNGLEKNHSYEYDNWNWLAIINNENGLQQVRSKSDEERYYEHQNDRELDKISQIEFSKITFKNLVINRNTDLSSSISYSPHLDLEEPNFDSPDYINVSSDFIIYHESRNKEDSDQNISQMIDFRRNEIKRQIAFMQYAELKQNDSIQFYKEFNRESIRIEFNQFIKKFDSDPRYISFEDITVYKKIDKQFLSYNGSLNHNIKRKKSGTDGELALLWFFKRLFEIIYYNVEYRGESEIDNDQYRLKMIDSFQLEEDNLIENFKKYFINQSVINSTQLALLFVEINLIFKNDLEYTEDDKSFICSLTTAKKLMILEQKILDLLPYSSKLPLFNIDWQGMSTGEKAYLNLFSRLHYGLNILDNHPKIKDSKKVYFLIDEPSTGFHPQWQKEYLNKLLSFLDVRFPGKKHLIISSHSPFLVSDLQKEDVVALSKDNQFTFSKENTFGANIQDLLADNFFLQNGFIGDFSKNKIDELIDILTSNEKFSEQEITNVQNLISIIGEPLIKDRLQEIYDEKFKSRSDIEKEIQRLKNLLKFKSDEKN